MNSLPEVKKFIREDLPLFHDTVFRPKPGAAPELLFLGDEDEVVERVRLDKKDRQQCNDLLIEKGFYKKKNKDEKVPEEYKNGPYIPVDIPEKEL